MSSTSALYTSEPLGAVLEPKRGSWLQVMSHLSPQYGGIAASVPRLARATEMGSLHSCPIVGFCGRQELDDVPLQQRTEMKVFSPSRVRWMVDAHLQRNFRDVVSAAAGVHIHGVWETHCMMASRSARAAKLPYIISAHGMLEQWALRHKRLKKAFYAALIEIRGMQRASCLRALSTDEVDDYRRLGLTNPIAIIPNGTEAQTDAAPDWFWQAYPQLAGKRIVLFLGRLHQKKGLQLLLEAWARSGSKLADAHLVIAGPDSENTLAALQTQTEELGLTSSVTFAGMLNSEQKWSALAAASLFVLPSYSEGFSVAVIEAMSMGLPVIVTTGCHIPEVKVHNCGWVIPSAVDPLRQAMQDFLGLSGEEALQMGRRGRDLARTRFHSSVVGKQMAQVYDWLQGGNKPAGVEIA